MADARIFAPREVGREFRKRRQWTRKAILDAARIGKFSGDRSVREYARDRWGPQSV